MEVSLSCQCKLPGFQVLSNDVMDIWEAVTKILSKSQDKGGICPSTTSRSAQQSVHPKSSPSKSCETIISKPPDVLAHRYPFDIRWPPHEHQFNKYTAKSIVLSCRSPSSTWDRR
ncbi:hypothetical protein O181_039394 [Austropuccinia psidii MF-1]|uniref:Uncharacterized protein n=1 Tax=Austropuccinia psidii MF-1 TaxID=1389203 RepID=A0A9Q3DAD1_9BASI|nr:hypothetical protein [Austropuccinia psidii MF-1]